MITALTNLYTKHGKLRFTAIIDDGNEINAELSLEDVDNKLGSGAVVTVDQLLDVIKQSLHDNVDYWINYEPEDE